VRAAPGTISPTPTWRTGSDACCRPAWCAPNPHPACPFAPADLTPHPNAGFFDSLPSPTCALLKKIDTVLSCLYFYFVSCLTTLVYVLCTCTHAHRLSPRGWVGTSPRREVRDPFADGMRTNPYLLLASVLQFGVIVLTTANGILDHEEARRKKVGGKVLGREAHLG